MMLASNGYEVGTLLLVEDDQDDADLMGIWLDRAETDWHLLHARCLADALTMLGTFVPDLIISDLGLPDARGVGAAEALATKAPDVPLVVLTGNTRQDLAVDALGVGAEDYIIKDEITEDILRRAINFAVTRHSARRRLASLEGSLAVADNDLEQYASMVAHDLRSPLRTSRLLSQAIGKELTDNGREGALLADPDLDTTCRRVSDLAARLDTTLGRLDQIVLSMLDYSNVERSEPNVGPVQLRRVVEEVIDAVAADLDGVEATITINIDDDLAVTGAETPMWRIVENLLSNSIKFRSPNRPLQIEVSATTQGDKGTVQISVEDNGVGIPPTEADRVFLPLERLDHTAAGCGFGLAICRRHIHALGGEIWLDETPRPVGSAIVLELPIP